MKRFIAILFLGAFFLSLTSCAAMRKRKCNKCPKFTKVEPVQHVKDVCDNNTGMQPQQF